MDHTGHRCDGTSGLREDRDDPAEEVPPAAWLTAVHFDLADGAAATALDAVRTALTVTDPDDDRVTAAAVMSWERDDRRPRLRPVDVPGGLDHGLMELIFAATYLLPLVAAATHSPLTRTSRRSTMPGSTGRS